MATVRKNVIRKIRSGGNDNTMSIKSYANVSVACGVYHAGISNIAPHSQGLLKRDYKVLASVM